MDKERQSLIMDYLKNRKHASVKELASIFYTSEATIRRDLNVLQTSGQVQRSHGGVSLADNTNELSIYVRLAKNSKEKEQVALIALKHIPPFQTVFIDNSSTCLALAEKMNLSNKTVVTNGLQIALTLSQRGDVNIVMPGGDVWFNTNSVTGSMTVKHLSELTFDMMISSCSALDSKYCYEVSVDAATVKQVAFERSKTHILLADATKIGETALAAVKPLRLYDEIITNAPDEALTFLRNQGIKVFNH